MILISNEMPDETNTDENTIQPTYRLPTCFSIMPSFTPEQGIHDESENKNLHPRVRVDQAIRPLPLKTLSILVGLVLKLISMCNHNL